MNASAHTYQNPTPDSSSSATPSLALLQRKCACGSPAKGLASECDECRKKKLQRKPLRIGPPGDRFEQEADRLADAVVAGHGALARPASSAAMGLQRDGPGTEKSDQEKQTEALKKLGEAFLETPAGKQILERIKEDKLVSGGAAFASTLPGKLIAGTAASGAVAALAATHKPLPAQIPEIQFDWIKPGLAPGLSFRITWEGPVDHPSSALISFKYTEQAPSRSQRDSPAPSASDRMRAETARLAAADARFRAGLRYPPGSPEDLRQKAEQAALQGALRRFAPGPDLAAIARPPPASGPRLTLPQPDFGYRPRQPSIGDALRLTSPAELPGQADKKRDEPILQRKPASQGTSTTAAPPLVHETLASAGQPLDAGTRAFMALRLGHDFSRVRIHADSRAAASARAVDAQAYTVGEHIAFDNGMYSPHTARGRHLLAHELVHTLQQGQAGDLVQRKGEPEAPATDAPAGDPVTAIVIDPGSGRTRFFLDGGETIDGLVVFQASTFPVGEYRLERAKNSSPGHIWDIWNADGTMFRGGVQFTVVLEGTNPNHLPAPNSLPYAPSVQLRVARGVLPTLVDIDKLIAAIKAQVEKRLVLNAEELAIIRLLASVPAEQAEAFVKRLREERVGEIGLLERMDKDIDGENNIALHEALSRLKLQGGGRQSAAALADAPTLAWHDVMGFFQQKAVFSVTRTARGTVLIRYLGAISSGLYANPEYAEIAGMDRKARLDIMTGRGIEVRVDQPINVRDYDADRTVVLTAEDLIAYQHAGVRKFLADIGMIASLATPAGAETVGARVLAYGTQILTVATLIVDENKLNIRRWFPNWGPAIIDTSEKIKIVIAGVGIAQLVRGGWKLVDNLRKLRSARAAMDSAAIVGSADELARAERQADLARKEMGLVDDAADTSKLIDHKNPINDRTLDAEIDDSFKKTFNTTPETGTKISASQGIVPAAPEIAAGFNQAQVQNFRRLLGKSFSHPNIQILEQLWNKAARPGDRAILELSNSRYLFDLHRNRFWTLVRENDAASAIFKNAGCEFSGGAPYFTLNGRKILITIDHLIERQTKPELALTASNLRIVFWRENTVVLRLLNKLDPFQ